MTDNRKAIFYAAITVASWSTVATAFKMSLRHFTHFEMLTVASAAALAVFAIALTLQGKWRLLGRLTGRQWAGSALCGLLNPIAYYLVLFKAYALLPAQVAQPINYFWPIVLLVMIAVSTRTPIPAAKYFGMALSLAGVALVSLGPGMSDGGRLSAAGLALAFLSAILWASYWMINNLRKGKDATVNLFVGFLSGTVCLAVAALCLGADLSSPEGLMWSSYVGVFEMGVPFIFFGLALRKTDDPALVNQMCYLAPFISLFLIHLVLGEQIRTATYAGLALIVAGIVFNEYLAGRFKKEATGLAGKAK